MLARARRALRRWQAQADAIRGCVERSGDAALREQYNESLRQLAAFREMHRAFARSYIAQWKCVPRPLACSACAVDAVAMPRSADDPPGVPCAARRRRAPAAPTSCPTWAATRPPRAVRSWMARRGVQPHKAFEHRCKRAAQQASGLGRRAELACFPVRTSRVPGRHAHQRTSERASE
eukprot:scaffold3011_cov290-Prasinococcus_capsulatus_cf.AAC.4